jgi:Ca2+-binding RTX toxin-like protein
MGALVVYDQTLGANFDSLDFRPFVSDVVDVDGSQSSITISLVDQPNVSLVLKGSFTYSADGESLTGGSVNSAELHGAGGALTMNFTPVQVLSLLDAVRSQPPAVFLENLLATKNNIQATPNADLLRGFGGDDNINGDGGADTMFGGPGDDALWGMNGDDYLRGDEGNDLIEGGDGFDDLNGNMGNDVIDGEGGDDWTVGGKDNDRLNGGDGGDIVYGNLGADTCSGGNGDDIVRGGQEDDEIRGGPGNDWLSGDRGNDTVTGDAGADIFHSFGEAGIDRVTDFTRADGDRVLLDPGTSYTVAQVDSDTVISMNGGGQVILVGVQMSTLTGDWISVA